MACEIIQESAVRRDRSERSILNGLYISCPWGLGHLCTLAFHLHAQKDAAALGSRLINDHSPDVCSEYAGAAESQVKAASDTSEGMETEISMEVFSLTHPI